MKPRFSKSFQTILQVFTRISAQCQIGDRETKAVVVQTMLEKQRLPQKCYRAILLKSSTNLPARSADSI
ncbi:hypothetical protein C7B79_20800 [Chroococcidiopsis cubana CCALA 043]|nr:hypothetical protein C7B79_20800 [Chroococcidiopsis cubana CCALA 043]